MNKEIKVYVINCDECSATPDNATKMMNDAEKQGTVYSLKGFEDAINHQQLFLDNSYILIK